MGEKKKRTVSVRLGVDAGVRAKIQARADKHGMTFEEKVEHIFVACCNMARRAEVHGLPPLQDPKPKEGKNPITVQLRPEDYRYMKSLSRRLKATMGGVIHSLLKKGEEKLDFLDARRPWYLEAVKQFRRRGLR